jgi:arabinogalactan endo-1,4-beta-galactosidase
MLAEERTGTQYSSNGVGAPLEQILAANGANYVRIRLWVNPADGSSDLANALAIGRRATAAGLKIFLDLHYSDWWADDTTQTIPAAWAGQSLTALTSTVRTYTTGVMSAFANQGTHVSMVEVGNEIDAGILWPIGKVSLDGSGNWAAFGQLLNAGIAGARAAEPTVKIVLHTALGSDNGAATAFYYHVIAAGVTNWDILGLSYYPFWQSNLAALSSNLDSLANRYARPVLIVETSYPWTLSNTTSSSWVTTTAALPDGALYPPTPAGQAGYYSALRNVVAAVPSGRGLGFLAWEPGWLPGVAAVPGQTTPAFANLTLFDNSGSALPALSQAFRN